MLPLHVPRQLLERSMATRAHASSDSLLSSVEVALEGVALLLGTVSLFLSVLLRPAFPIDFFLGLSEALLEFLRFGFAGVINTASIRTIESFLSPQEFFVVVFR